jgi:hypothetical protein
VTPSVGHLLARLRVIEARVRAAVARRRSADPNPDDPFRGLYLTEDDVERLLAGRAAPDDRGLDADVARAEAAADEAERAGADLRLRRLARTFELEPLDVDLLLVALAPDLDARYERLYGYLHDDVTRRRASIGLALELAGAPPEAAEARGRLASTGALVDGGLVLVEDDDRPFLTRALRVPDRVTMHLLGDDRPDSQLAPLLAAPLPRQSGDENALARALVGGARLAYVREQATSAGRALAGAAFASCGRDAVAVDLGRLLARDDVWAIARSVLREARLRDAGVVAGPVDAALAVDASALRAFAELRWPTVLAGS